MKRKRNEGQINGNMRRDHHGLSLAKLMMITLQDKHKVSITQVAGEHGSKISLIISWQIRSN
jgi:hypothetical protein